MSDGEFLIEEQKARMQAIKDSEFRAANDDGGPATDLAGVGPSSLSPPEGLVKVWVEDEEFGEHWQASIRPADLIAAIRVGVESGTIKGEVATLDLGLISAEGTEFKPGIYLVIGPVSDGGSET